MVYVHIIFIRCVKSCPTLHAFGVRGNVSNVAWTGKVAWDQYCCPCRNRSLWLKVKEFLSLGFLIYYFPDPGGKSVQKHVVHVTPMECWWLVTKDFLLLSFILSNSWANQFHCAEVRRAIGWKWEKNLLFQKISPWYSCHHLPEV